MKHLFIINPKAGKKDSTAHLLEHIYAVFSHQSCEVALTHGVGDARRIAEEAVARQEPLRIYACGGDGTLNEVVNAAAGCDWVAVTNVPKGTGNDFLRIFGKDGPRRFTDLAALRDGPQAALDLMDCNGLLGVGVACAGIDARVADDVHRYKSLPLLTGGGAYILALIENVLFKGIARPMKVDMGDIHFDSDAAILCVCSGRYYGGGFMPVGDAQPDDGVLDMLLIPKVGRVTLAKLVGKYAKGRYRELPGLITHYHGQRVDFSFQDEQVAVVDGEVMRGKSFTICLSEKKINFFYPPDVFWRESSQSANKSKGSILQNAR